MTEHDPRPTPQASKTSTSRSHRRRTPTTTMPTTSLKVLLLAICLGACVCSAFFYAPPALKRKATPPPASSSTSASLSSSAASAAAAHYEKAHALVAAARPRTPIFWMAPLLMRLWKNKPSTSKRGGAKDCDSGGDHGGCGCGGGGGIPGSRLSSAMVLAASVSSSADNMSPRNDGSSSTKTIAAPSKPVHVVAVVPGNGARGKLEAPWTEVMEHMHRRMQYVDPAFSLHVVTEEDLLARGLAALADLPVPASSSKHAHKPSSFSSSSSAPNPPDILYFFKTQNPAIAPLLQHYIAQVPHVLALDSCPILTSKTRIGPARPYGPLAGFWKALPLPTERKRLLTLFETVQGFWERGHSDDVLYSVLVVINAVMVDIPAVSEILKPVTFQALQCMLTNCGKQIVDCQRNPACKAALACLESCPPNDQVCRYRCIVQYESTEFEQFALCILQKHNCLQNQAAIPMSPDPAPITHFRGEKLTHEIAQEIQFGHLGGLHQKLPWSWKVISGVNPAYDFFPSQHMTYYQKGKALWYQPVFRVITFDGKQVWRRRLYRVRRAMVPGTFYYTVLDNGVTSSEFWRIIDAAEDMSWVLFYYSGAAAAAGQSYTGAILASPTGEWPTGPEETYKPRILAALDRAGIKEWELFKVHHDGSEGAPLEIDPLAEGRFMYPGWAGAKKAGAGGGGGNKDGKVVAVA